MKEDLSKEEIRKKLIHGLSNYMGNISDVTIKHCLGEIPKITCTVTIPDFIVHPDVEKRIGDYRRSPLETLIENERFGLNVYDYYSYNDWVTTMKTYNAINKDGIKKVHFSGPVTAVIWGDGSKTIVRCDEDEFDPEKGLAMAIAKHFLGTNKSKGNYYNVFEKWLPKDTKLPELSLPQEPIGVTMRKALNNALDSLAFDFKIKETDSDETDNS